MKPIQAQVSETGRLSLPSEVRKAVGLDRGGTVVIDLEDGVIRLRTVDQVIARAQAIARRLSEGRPGMSVDDFLAERRREAQREEEKEHRRERARDDEADT
jgi:AbrB family looped-hinge helix DNA binding protein